MGRQERGVYSYKETVYSVGGITASILGLVSLVLLMAMTVTAMMAPDNVTEWMGALGFTAFVVAFIGMVKGLGSFHENCKSYLFSKIGTILCGLMVAAWFLLFCVGLAH